MGGLSFIFFYFILHSFVNEKYNDKRKVKE